MIIREGTNMQDLGEFEKIIGYEFKDKSLVFEALSHSSFANENKKERRSNERLEFLGDSVLSIVVSDYLFENYTNLPEGALTKTRASLVCEKSLYVFAKEIQLGKYIMLGKGEENMGGRERASILADAFEAVIAAIYLDGGMDAAKKHIMRFVTDERIKMSGSAMTTTKRFCRKSYSKILRKRSSTSLSESRDPTTTSILR